MGTRRTCRHFFSAKGCAKGSSCSFAHETEHGSNTGQVKDTFDDSVAEKLVVKEETEESTLTELQMPAASNSVAAASSEPPVSALSVSMPTSVSMTPANGLGHDHGSKHGMTTVVQRMNVQSPEPQVSIPARDCSMHEAGAVEIVKVEHLATQKAAGSAAEAAAPTG